MILLANAADATDKAGAFAIDWMQLVLGLLILIIGLPLIKIAARKTKNYLTSHNNTHLGAILSKIIWVVGTVMVVLSAVTQIGWPPLTPLLAAAGVVTVAVGFASQTSVANIISGIFLLLEKPFQIGDAVRIDDTVGIVVSIDLMSVKFRGLDNLFIRLPNEYILKNRITNITRFPIRRLDIDVGVAYKEDPDRVMRILREIADNNPFALDEPEPLVVFKDFGDSSLNFMLGIWIEKTNFLNLKNSIMRDIKVRFDAEDIEIPFPHISVYSGSQTEPFPFSMSPESPRLAPPGNAEGGDAPAKT
jgi:small-conductance mechanosensitive channel